MTKHINQRILLPLIEALVVLVVIGLVWFERQNILNDVCVSKMGDNFQSICRYNGSAVKNEEALNIKSGDKLYLAFNLKAILKSPSSLHNALTEEAITDVNLQDGQICIVVYPVLMQKYMLNYNQQDFDNFYKNYKWSILPKNILANEISGPNFICTKRMNLTKLNNLFLDLNIPTKQYLSLAQADTFIYGVKLLFVPTSLLGSIKVGDDVNSYYDQLIPFYLYNKTINLGQ